MQQDILDLLDALLAHNNPMLHPLVRQHLLQQVALLVNKFLKGDMLAQVEERLWTMEGGVLSPGKLSRSSIRSGFWIVKALFLRLANVPETMSRIIDLLSDKTFGPDVALAFELILSPDDLLSKQNGATIRLLSSQKIFSTFLTEISKRLAGATPGQKSNYFTALAGLLKYLSSALVMMQGDSLLPLLSQAISLDNPMVKESAIRTLTTLVDGSPEILETHASSLINRLVQCTGKLETGMIVNSS